MRTVPSLALLLTALLVQVAPAVSSAQSQNRYLNAAMKLYGDMEYESALDNFKKAEKQPDNTMQEDVQISLYMGLVQVELGDLAGAESAFKKALALDDTTRLPKGVSPKVAAVFEKARKDMAKARPPKPLVQQPDPKPTDVPRVEPRVEDKPKQLVAVATPEVPLSRPTPEVKATASSSGRTLGLAVAIPLMVIGAGLMGGGAYFGVDAQGLSNDAKAATFQSDAKSLSDRAQSSATNANILYGVGGGVVAAGVITLVVALATSSGAEPGVAGRTEDFSP